MYYVYVCGRMRVADLFCGCLLLCCLVVEILCVFVCIVHACGCMVPAVYARGLRVRCFVRWLMCSVCLLVFLFCFCVRLLVYMIVFW